MSVKKSGGKKVAKLVVEAIQSLKAEKGFTPKEIMKFISENHGLRPRMAQCVQTTLKRGREYGILQATGGRYDIKIGSSERSPMMLEQKDGSEQGEDACSQRGRSRRHRSRRRRHRHTSPCGHRRRKRSSRRRSGRRGSRRKCGKRRLRSRRRRRSGRRGSRRKCGERRLRSRRRGRSRRHRAC